MIFAVIQGYRRGLIVAVFSVLALFIGLAAALKLSAVTADYIGQAIKVSDRWLPVIAFAVVFIIVVLLVRWAAVLLQKSVEVAMLGWVNRLGGIFLYIVLFTLILSILFFYTEQLQLLKEETTRSSVIYHHIKSWGPQTMEAFGKIIPFFKGMFQQLEDFFDSVSKQIPQAG